MPHRLFSRPSCLLAGFLAASLVLPAAAYAQQIGSGIGSGFDPGQDSVRAPTGGPQLNPDDAARDAAGQGGDPSDAKEKKLEPPPTLPGSHAQPIPTAPLDKNAGDMNPNAALFDAINRGDTVAARDALSRGADPEARNVLGLTPIDLSVDLGRNDISFLLLSMRSTDQTASPASPAMAARSSAPAPKGAVAARAPHPARGKLAASAPAPQAGAPVPAAGYLGFGGGS